MNAPTSPADDGAAFRASAEPREVAGVSVQLISVSGDVDLLVAEEFAAVLDAAADAGAESVIVDLGEVSFMDASGLHALLRTADGLRRDGTPITVAATPGSRVERLMSLSGVEDRFELASSFDDAAGAIDDESG